MLLTRIMAVLSGAMEPLAVLIPGFCHRIIELPLLNVSLLLRCLLYLLADTYVSDDDIHQDT